MFAADKLQINIDISLAGACKQLDSVTTCFNLVVNKLENRTPVYIKQLTLNRYSKQQLNKLETLQ